MHAIQPEREVCIKVAPISRMAKAETYKFPWDVGLFLKWKGWVEVKKGRSYCHLSPPDSTATPPFIIDSAVPTREQVIALAQEGHAAGEPWVERVGDWPAVYTPRRRMTTERVDPFTHERSDKKELSTDPYFYIGISPLWMATVVWKGNAVSYYETRNGILPSGSFQRSLFSGQVFVEGGQVSVELTKHERNPVVRDACIAHHGAICKACSFDFAQVYGEIAEGFIHVHHVDPISKAEGEREVDPIRDLVPVCPNCHAVIHMKDPPHTIEEVKRLIAAARRPK